MGTSTCNICVSRRKLLGLSKGLGREGGAKWRRGRKLYGPRGFSWATGPVSICSRREAAAAVWTFFLNQCGVEFVSSLRAWSEPDMSPLKRGLFSSFISSLPQLVWEKKLRCCCILFFLIYQKYILIFFCKFVTLPPVRLAVRSYRRMNRRYVFWATTH